MMEHYIVPSPTSELALSMVDMSGRSKGYLERSVNRHEHCVSQCRRRYPDRRESRLEKVRECRSARHVRNGADGG